MVMSSQAKNILHNAKSLPGDALLEFFIKTFVKSQ